MSKHPRSIEHIVDQMARRAELSRGPEPEAPRSPVIAFSRQAGAGGRQVARRVAEELALAFYDRDLLHEIAKSAHVSERRVSALDERTRDVVSEWLEPLVSDDYLGPNAYREHLAHVVDTIARRGGAVILGRGAHLLLGPSRALRVLVVAPLAMRVAEVARADGVSPEEARRRIAAVESARHDFLARHFRVAFDDVSNFDLVVNTGVVGVEGAVSIVRSGVGALPAPHAALARA